jgi:hypothetical protein
MSDFLETEELGKLSPEVQKVLTLFELPGAKLRITGSARYKHLQYKSD